MSGESGSESTDERRGAVGQPQEDELPRALILRTLLVAVTIAVSLCFATYLILRARLLQLRPSYSFPERTLPAPHTVAEVRQELFQLANPRPTILQHQHASLQTFGWVDRTRGLVRLPIATAIDLVARQSQAGSTP